MLDKYFQENRNIEDCSSYNPMLSYNSMNKFGSIHEEINPGKTLNIISSLEESQKDHTEACLYFFLGICIYEVYQTYYMYASHIYAGKC